MNWQVKKLGEVCNFYNGKAHEGYIDNAGKYIVVNSKFISSDGKKYKKTNKALFPLFSGDIAMVMSDVPNGKALAKCFVVDSDNKYTLNQRICAFRSNNFESRYLYYQLSRNHYFLSFNNGKTQTNLRKNDILRCPLIVPPLTQQKLIAGKIDKLYSEVDTAIEKTKVALDLAKNLFQSEATKCFRSAKKSGTNYKLEDIADINPPKRRGFTPDYEVGFVPMEAVDDKTGTLIGLRTVYFSDVSNGYTSFIDRDVLFAKITPCMENGKCAVVESLPNGLGFGSTEFYVIRPKNNIVPYYIWLFLRQENIRQQAKRSFTGSSGHKRVSKEFMKNLEIPLPIRNENPDIEGQKEIVKILENTQKTVDELVNKYETQSSYFETLKQSLLNQAFQGKL